MKQSESPLTSRAARLNIASSRPKCSYEIHCNSRKPRPGEHREISALHALCQTGIKPYLTGLPSPRLRHLRVQHRAQRRSPQHGLAIKHPEQGRVLDKCDGESQTEPSNPPELFSSTNRSESSAPWTVSPLHCLLSEPRGAAAGRPAWDSRAAHVPRSAPEGHTVRRVKDPWNSWRTKSHQTPSKSAKIVTSSTVMEVLLSEGRLVLQQVQDSIVYFILPFMQ